MVNPLTTSPSVVVAKLNAEGVREARVQINDVTTCRVPSGHGYCPAPIPASPTRIISTGAKTVTLLSRASQSTLFPISRS